jgi:hypothetical protein
MNTSRSSPGEAPDTPAQAVPIDTDTGSAGAADTTSVDDGAPAVFTPDDVGLRPPDHPPTESAPESEKAGLIFERS